MNYYFPFFFFFFCSGEHGGVILRALLRCKTSLSNVWHTTFSIWLLHAALNCRFPKPDFLFFFLSLLVTFLQLNCSHLADWHKCFYTLHPAGAVVFLLRNIHRMINNGEVLGRNTKGNKYPEKEPQSQVEICAILTPSFSRP